MTPIPQIITRHPGKRLTIEQRLQNALSDLDAANQELARLKGNPDAAIIHANKGISTPPGKPPGASQEDKIKAAYEAAAKINDPVKRASAMREAHKLL